MGEDAQVARREAHAGLRGADHRDHPGLRRVRGVGAGRGPPERGVRYQRITVERPLRLRWSGDGLRERLETARGFAKLDDDARAFLLTAAADPALAAFDTTDRAEAKSASDTVLLALDGAVPRSAGKVVVEALAVRDPEAPAVTGPASSPGPDPELRDQENVPLPAGPVTFEPDPTERLASAPYRTPVDEYMAAEVLPYVPDAWVDHGKTKPGYEIPLTWHSYCYVPPRPFEEIDAEIRTLEEEIQSLLNEVTRTWL